MNELLNKASKNDPAICPNGCGHEYKELSCSWLTQLNWITQLDPASCPNKCGKLYRGPYRKHHLRQHLVYECGVIPKFQCKICSKRFARNPQLKYHLIRIHKIVA
ncbi:longitudinals lacking protein, isoforms A/B/D/L-like [Acyrthosiphon pisum]|uniref:C2H2-type domain-containing protein n=1 Tax=Acyrthosiphon pisum TaxID=7029 RepID=A0A8R2D5F9_ACYPI|nr:longitudinals lacking protein, isoforms A/B/D/L-like [Acyrthosiphon pisum]|eukprot:XP_016662409.1 PREDICTED: longitudinals lacking protein, isoforms A/B/D/L-like [Acyrthosiphon pisum]